MAVMPQIQYLKGDRRLAGLAGFEGGAGGKGEAAELGIGMGLAGAVGENWKEARRTAKGVVPPESMRVMTLSDWSVKSGARSASAAFWV